MQEVNDFVESFRAYLAETGVTQEAAAKLFSVSQSQVSDWMNGNIHRLGVNPRRAMVIIENYRKSKERPIPRVIEEAVRRVWTGNERDAQAIADVINSLDALRQ